MGCYETAMYKYLIFKEENHFIELILMVFHKLDSFFLFLKTHSAPPPSPEIFLLFYSRIDSVDKWDTKINSRCFTNCFLKGRPNILALPVELCEKKNTDA